MKHVDWWKNAATHIWRSYFAMKRDGVKPNTDTKRKTHFLCGRILQEFNNEDVEFLEGYFLTEWGQDAVYLDRYSAETGMGKVYLWRLVEDANRRFFEECGLLEPQRKDGA